MATPLWQPSRLYPPGSLVQPVTAAPPADTSITNPGFESGSTDWTLDSGVTITTGSKFSGTSAAEFSGSSGAKYVVHDPVPCAPGKSITAGCMYQQGAASSGQNTGCVILRWLDASDAIIREDKGTIITSSSGGWKSSSVSKTAPANTAKVSIGCLSTRTHSEESYADAFTWDYLTQATPDGLIYRAVQAVTGYSDSDEPVWPTTLGVQVVDNEVTWEAVLANRVIWEASPIMLSGAVEPVWPTDVGEFIADNTISWEVISRRVEDEKCPNSKVVAIMAGKVFAGDRDIVRFSATANPLDWTTPDDAGYLPTGLQQANANDIAVLQPYRSNLCPFNASSFQNWQVDPDPAAMAILDQMEGIGSIWQHAAQSVGNELFYLSQRGVRTVGIAAGAENLAAGDVGMPIDPLVQAVLDNTVRPLATYYPSMGQYWLAMRPPLPVYVGPTVTGDPPNGIMGTAWPGFAFTITPGDAAVTATMISEGSLPPGFNMDAGGVIAPVSSPAVGGTYEFTVESIDTNGLTGSHETSIYIEPVWEWVQNFGNDLRAIASDDDGNIIVAGNGVSNVGELWLTDADAEVYTQITGHPVSSIYSLAWGKISGVGYWVAGSAGATALVSTDRVTWTSEATANSFAVNHAVFLGDRFMRLGASGAAEYATNPAGLWSSQSFGSSNAQAVVVDPDVTPGSPYIVCVFMANGAIRRSVDGGVNWTDPTIVGPDPHAAIGFGNHSAALIDGVIRGYKYVNGTTVAVYTSTDHGANFSTSDITVTSNIYNGGPVAEIDGELVGIQNAASAPAYVQLFRSADGLSPFVASSLIPGVATVQNSTGVALHDNGDGTGVAVGVYSDNTGFAYRYRYSP